MPDARLPAEWDFGERATEVMRGNPRDQVVREEVMWRLLRYVPDARRVPGLQVMCLCESEALMPVVVEEAASICREHDVDLQAAPVLEQNWIVAPAREGRPEVWRSLSFPLKLYLEYERSAVERQGIRDKLMPYVRVTLAGHPCAVIFICETQRAEKLFQEEHQRLQREHQVSFMLITSTYEAVTTQARRGRPWSMDGQPVHLI